MQIDLSALIKNTQEEVDATANSGSKGDGYPIVYPGEVGKITFRILYNIKSNTVQRRIVRHGKTGCLGYYGEDCPVCAAIHEAETVKGKDCGAFRKYGYKTRGICLAKVIDADAAYVSGNNKRFDKGDVIILMYPKSVYEEINKIIVEAGANLEQIVSHNNGIPIVLENTGKQGSTMYKVSLFPYGPQKAFDDPDGDKKFDELLESLPSLSETIIPMHPTDDNRKELKAMAETVIQEYINGNVINPSDVPEGFMNAPEPIDEDIPFASPDQSAKPVNNTPEKSVNPAFNPEPNKTEEAPKEQTQTAEVPAGMPECFGQHSDTDNKCLICTNEGDCFMKTHKK